MSASLDRRPLTSLLLPNELNERSFIDKRPFLGLLYKKDLYRPNKVDRCLKLIELNRSSKKLRIFLLRIKDFSKALGKRKSFTNMDRQLLTGLPVNVRSFT